MLWLAVAAWALGAAGTLRADAPAVACPAQQARLSIAGTGVCAMLAANERERSVGLMFRATLPEDTGMLFLYPAPGLHAMWMKNTLIPLSVAFIDGGGRIINIEEMAPRTEDVHGAIRMATYSLEMAGGWFAAHHIKPGDQIQGLQSLPKGN